MNQPEKEYGWITALTPLEVKALGYKLCDDEVWCYSGHWAKAYGFEEFFPASKYRRRINPGPGCEIVGLDSTPFEDDEVTYDGVHWTEIGFCTWCQMSVRNILKSGSELLAIRRKLPVAQDAASPQPAPNGGTVDITSLVKSDLDARAAMGEKKYGQRLKAHNGRNAIMDAYQEACDLVCYIRQAIEERGDKTCSQEKRTGAAARGVASDRNAPEVTNGASTPPWIKFSERRPTEGDLKPGFAIQLTDGIGVSISIVIPTVASIEVCKFTHWRLIAYPADLPQPDKSSSQLAFEKLFGPINEHKSKWKGWQACEQWAKEGE